MLNYPLWFGILQGFTDVDNAVSKAATDVKNVKDPKRNFYELEKARVAVKENFKDNTALGTFVDNHDHARFLGINGRDHTNFMHAMTFILFNQGVPIIYYGSEQGYYESGDP
jgi:alpha-amylase